MKASSDLIDPPKSPEPPATKIEVQLDQIYQPEHPSRSWPLSLETLVGRVIALSAISVGIFVILALVADRLL